MGRARRRFPYVLALCLLAASVLTACTLSVAGGVLGGGLAMLLTLLLLAGSTVTQSGCEAIVSTCLSIESDLGVCLSAENDADPGFCLATDAGYDANLGPCLQPIPPEAGVDACLSTDAYIGPCLQPFPPEAGVDACLSADAYLGPCLQPFPPEAGLDAAPPADATPDAAVDARVGPCLDIAPDAGPRRDAHLGPCLSPPPPPPPLPEDAGAALVPAAHPAAPARHARAAAREHAIDRVLDRGTLPADVAARLRAERREG